MVVHPPMEHINVEGERECHPGGFPCPECGTILRCLNDYPSGGSHYWTLRCDVHGRFVASNYRYGAFDGTIPRAWPE